ncbi:hypothetical protein [Frankia sp. QA3]|uniref:hypothetical protein n=1 Tax=Frankia sp. QA3 TaxID=710111 RepID=UPI000269CDF8|nr:hypothetical protein [Frankia sp. QA3]EIV96168.1 hypothetical protein FraQA3DRAFT_6036 [Frankia sp. QA3]
MPHRFVAGDGQLIVLDVWRPTEAFHQLFIDPPAIGTLMRDAGVADPPEIPVWQPTEGAPDTP